MVTIILLALVGAVIAAVVGTVWYSNATPMGRLHMKYLGFDKLSPEAQQALMKEAMPKMPKIYAAQLVLSFLTAFFTVFVITMSVQNGLSFWMAFIFPIVGWLCFVVPTVGSSLLWGNCDPKIAWAKFFSDIGSVLVTIILTALLTGLVVGRTTPVVPTDVPTNGKLNITVVCESALAYTTFTDGASAEAFVQDCIDGKHPEVIERYKADMNLGDGALI